MAHKSIVIPDCPCCKHCQGNYKTDPPIRCAAFPDGIPKEYLFGPVLVKEIPECGNGYKYEEIKD